MIFAGFFHILKEIFIEDDFYESQILNIRELSSHYVSEIPDFSLDRVFVASDYRYLQKKIERFKYHSDREYLREFTELYTHLKGFLDPNTHYTLVPVPMHWSRYFLRGYNHTSLLARDLSEALSIPLSEILTTSYRSRQLGKDRSARLRNKEKAFSLKRKARCPENIILLDDVISSGATVHECATILKRSGAKEVVGWFLASNNP